MSVAAWVLAASVAHLPQAAARLPAPEAAAELAATTRALAADPIVGEALEPDPDVLAAVRAACRRTALVSAPVAVRLDAMECAVSLGDAALPALLVHADEPEVRAGAAGLAPVGELVDVVRGDPAPLAAAAAAAALCGGDPAGAAARLGDDGRARVRALAADVKIDAGYRRAIKPCLRPR